MSPQTVAAQVTDESNHTHPVINDEDDALVRALDALTIKNKKLVKATTHDAPADPSIKIRSWKMDEFKYGVHPSPFPTLARGLFTRLVDDNGNTPALTPADEDAEDVPEVSGKHVIVVRGYDKFFNIGEVPWNSWPSIEKWTTGPYYLTLKSNGCIIFIAALSPTQVVVTSKHSMGAVTEGTTSHAMMGEKWLHEHLATKGKTVADLAQRLLKDNTTAVAELCDDSFEEHVLGYPPELTGLHLHGLNHNSRAFSTAPPSTVELFAEEFGFIKTATLTMDTIAEVRTFTDEVGESGTWRGEAVEGFVVRCKVTDTPNKPAGAVDDTSASPDPSTSDSPADPKRERGPKSTATMHPPYPAGSDYFFKIKFDEPYLMYRAWREITKVILTAKSKKPPVSGSDISIPKSRVARPESRLYRNWVEKEIDARPEDFAEYAKGKGIIETRERFLKWLESEEGQTRLEKVKAGEEEEVEPAKNDVVQPEVKGKGKLVIVPIAVPGCGKTSVAVALTHLFPSFGHTQSDDVKTKKTAPTFQRNITELLKTHSVVIADRNNHLAQHRQGIRAAADALNPKPNPKSPEMTPTTPIPVRLVALNWSLNTLPISTVHRHCATRVMNRGENHQSLRPSPTISHEDIIWQFITSSEELGDKEVDASVNMDVAAENLESSVTTALNGLIPLLNEWVEPPKGAAEWPMPSDEEVRNACDLARGYQVSIKKDEIPQGGKAVPTRYFAFLPEVNLSQVVESVFSTLPPPSDDAEAEGQAQAKAFWEALKAANRLTHRPHITIVHKLSLPDDQHIWDACTAVEALKISPALFNFTLGTLLCDDRVMSITVDDLKLVTPPPIGQGEDEALEKIRGASAEAANALLQVIPETTRARYHITVGTREEDIRPIEGGKLVERWKAGATRGIAVFPLSGERAVGRVRGLAG
ncbi:hypothetical protein DL93DRAFT_2073938 [Clavulina sp. PMI_390]|nr:hypothetical protein DL93DRAFT_2073938 [Clavulina sp. PMI_390]